MSGTLNRIKEARPRVASKPAPPPAPLIGPSGNAKLDAMGDIINKTAAPFQNAPDPAKGTLGQIEHGIGAVMGVVGAPFELLDTGFAMITAPLAAMVPGFPAATLMAPHLGTPHAHSHPPSLVPPAPPVPLPSIGTVMCAGCVSVLIGGIPAARASDIGLAPVCFSFAPAFEIYTGSSNTFFGGSRAARMMDITRHCNPASAMGMIGKAMGAIGVVAGAVGAGASAAAGQAMQAAMQAAQAAADAAALAMSALLGKDPGIPPSMGAVMLGNPTVLIGGFPMPDVLELLGGIAKGIKKLGKVLANNKTVQKAFGKVGLCIAPGEPVSSFTGDVYNDFEDFKAQDSGFIWARHYRSNWNGDDGPLGHGFRHFYERRLTLLRKRALYETHDGEQVAVPRNERDEFIAASGFRLTTHDGSRYVLETDRDEHLEFIAEPNTSPQTARLVRYKTETVDLYLQYDAFGKLTVLSELVAGNIVDTVLVYDNEGHIVEVRRGQRGGTPIVISRYAYFDGCLTRWQDALGGVAAFEYDAEPRMIKGTDRRGYSFHWVYDPASGHCIKAGGDDGLWGIEASYRGSHSEFRESDGGLWLFKHYPDGTVSHRVDPEGGLLQYIKDDQGRIVKQITPGGTEYLWLYDNGKHTGRRDQWGYLVPPEDEDPNPPSPLAHDGPATPREWLFGRPSEGLPRPRLRLPSAVDYALYQLGPIARRGTIVPAPVRDVLGRVIETYHPDGSIERFQHDAEGNVIAHQDTSGHWIQREIASWNLLGAERSPLGSITRFAYTHRAERRAVADGAGNQTIYVRDKIQRISEIHRYGELFARYRYDVHNAVVEKQTG